MRSIANFSTKLSIAGLAVLMGMSAAWSNTLSEIQINAQDSGYGIVLKTDETAEMKKIVSSDDNMTIRLKDVEVSADLNTVYNNVANLENVTVAPAGKSDIKIVFKGEGIAKSKVYFENAKTALAPLKKSNQSIELSGPVSSYTPVYSPEAFAVEEEDQTAYPQLNEVLTKMHVTKAMLVTTKKYIKKAINKTKSGDINLVSVMGVIFILAALLLRPSKKQRPASKKQKLQSAILARTQDNLQMEREIALGQRMADNMPIPKADGFAAASPVNAGYGMKAYQNSLKNPYVSEAPAVSSGVSGIPRRRTLNPQAGTNTAPASVNRTSNLSNRTSAYANRTAAPVKRQTVSKQPLMNAQNPIASKKTALHNPLAAKSALNSAHNAGRGAEPSDLDSMKFLESITKIYEKNGRTDLAKGLKDNLRKAQLSGASKTF